MDRWRYLPRLLRLLWELGPREMMLLALFSLAGGLLPSAAYARTRRLWLPIGIHIGWDLVQNSIFGVAIAGHQLPGVLHAPLDGPPLLTGGSMGPEGSLVALVISLAVSTYLLARARQHGGVIQPAWRRNQYRHRNRRESAA